MKVVLVTSLERGGPVEQALLLAGGLRRCGATVVVVCCSADVASRFADEGVQTEVVPLRFPGDLRSAVRIWGIARGADVVHAHDRRAGLWTRVGPRPRRGGIRIYTAHGIPKPYHPPPAGPRRPGWRAILLYRGLDASLCARVDSVVVPSQAVADDLVARLGYPADKLAVIPNGITLPPFSPAGGELIGTLSLLEPFKGIEVFLRAVAQLAPLHPDWRFVTFGSGSDAERLAALARELGIDDRVERPGFVPGQEALRRMRVYVLSSYWENAPMALLEAMAAGIPVVATNVGGVPEIVDSTVAQVVPPGDDRAIASAIARLCTDNDLRGAQVASARQRVEDRYTATANAEASYALYERLLAAA
jgi:glycosyltransferase involved in cell wall biosynthesis